MKNSSKWLVGGGLLIAGTLVAGLAAAKIAHDHHDDDGYHGDHGKYHGKMMGRKGGKHMMRNRDDLVENLNSRFSTLDTDGDGQVSNDEFTLPMLAQFDLIDLDGDGTISRDERRAYKKNMRQKHKEMHQEQSKSTEAAS